MTRHRGFPQIEVLDIGKDSVGAYIKAEVSFLNESIQIRWGLDELTYKNLKTAISERYFDDMPGVKYKYYLLLIEITQRIGDSRDKLIRKSKVEVVLHKKRKDVEFECSELFSSNVAWFRSVKDTSEIIHLKWDNFKG